MIFMQTYKQGGLDLTNNLFMNNYGNGGVIERFAVKQERIWNN